MIAFRDLIRSYERERMDCAGSNDVHSLTLVATKSTRWRSQLVYQTSGLNLIRPRAKLGGGSGPASSRLRRQTQIRMPQSRPLIELPGFLLKRERLVRCSPPRP